MMFTEEKDSFIGAWGPETLVKAIKWSIYNCYINLDMYQQNKIPEMLRYPGNPPGPPG